MVRRQKWITDFAPQDPPSEVARETLRVRLHDVWTFAPNAADKAKNDIEYVHQLRVAVRRADAALTIYEDLSPRRRTRQLRKRLRRMRRTAGDARDLDVLIDRISNDSTRGSRTQRKVLLKQLSRDRRTAQRPLVKVIEREKRNRYKRSVNELVKRVRWRDTCHEPSFDAWAKGRMKPIVAGFFSVAQGELSSARSLHRMRIRGKQVRYAIELLSYAFDDSFRDELYPLFESVQTELGNINDHSFAIGFYQRCMERKRYRQSRDLLADLIELEIDALNIESDRFRTWWSDGRCRQLESNFNAALNERCDGSRPNPWLSDQGEADNVTAAG